MNAPDKFAYLLSLTREYAAKLGLGEDQALSAGMHAKSAKFREAGGAIYIPIASEPEQTT